MAYCDFDKEESTPFKRLFFDQNNLDFIQSLIIKNVYKCKGYSISKQDETELSIIMANMFKNISINPLDPKKFMKELDRLNKAVVDYCSNIIFREISIYIHYRATFSNQQNNFMELPTYVSSKGSNGVIDISERFGI